ncbi:MAG: tetratricopeptide repeat protein [Candidatus Gastranaerophilales bacterium]|nr:tetratricopeptide repeat protein [Candidatus Gastranaerophilales bacterium]
MKKILSILAISLSMFILANCAEVQAANITPKAPKISAKLKPIITKYRQGNYVGSMQDLEELVKTDPKDIYAKYYLALCYTRLGYKDEASILYKEIVKKDQNLTLSYYSQRALDCLENRNSPTCNPQSQNKNVKEELDDMDLFIQSGKRFHPAAQDRITKEKMERRLQEEEYIRKQKEQEAQMQQYHSYAPPTNEEIASALNTLSKIGMNPYNQQYNNPLAAAQMYNQYGAMGMNNPQMYNAILNNTNPDVTRMFLYNQMTQQNNMLNYGI